MKKIVFTFSLTSLVLLSCTDFNKTIKDTLNTKDSLSSANDNFSNTNSETLNNNDDSKNSVSFTAQKERLELAEKQLRALPQFAGKSIFIYKLIHFYNDGRIISKLQNPMNPAYIDSYKYENGHWQEPEPVVMHKRDEIQSHLIKLDNLPFANVYNVYTALSEKRKEIGSKSEDYTIYAYIQDNQIKWYPNDVLSDRSVYQIEYNADGTLKSFEQK